MLNSTATVLFKEDMIYSQIFQKKLIPGCYLYLMIGLVNDILVHDLKPLVCEPPYFYFYAMAPLLEEMDVPTEILNKLSELS